MNQAIMEIEKAAERIWGYPVKVLFMFEGDKFRIGAWMIPSEKHCFTLGGTFSNPRDAVVSMANYLGCNVEMYI